MKKFNVTGLCVAKEDYMVDISGKIKKIVELIDRRDYFTINRARQYGKTTTLSVLQKTISNNYICIRISFEGLGDESFVDSKIFCQTFIDLIWKALKYTSASEEYRNNWIDETVDSFMLLSNHITKMCKDNKIVLLIDEVDKTSNNRVFIHFLSMLREKYLFRKEDMDYTFHSVVLAGVYDIKNIKLKMINEGYYIPANGENKIYNSPWNIATDFIVDMSFNPNEIATMLDEYEKDHNTGMDICVISNEIYKYTGGYPFLVSRVCQIIDISLEKDWTPIGVQNSVKLILQEENTLFDDLFKNLENNNNLYELIYDMLIVGQKRIYSTDNPVIKLGMIYGIIKTIYVNDYLVISNKIFEIRICNYFISKDEKNRLNKLNKSTLQYDIINDKKFNMELCLRKFANHYKEIYNPGNEEDMAFLERHGRMVFLSYLKPLINGQGFYHIESQFTDLRRMDIVVDYGREQFVIELKRWNGDISHNKAYEQLLGYLESKNMESGYLVTFDFRKNSNKEYKSEWVQIEGKKIFDVII